MFTPSPKPQEEPTYGQGRTGWDAANVRGLLIKAEYDGLGFACRFLAAVL
jgi:hypothetical protein